MDSKALRDGGDGFAVCSPRPCFFKESQRQAATAVALASVVRSMRNAVFLVLFEGCPSQILDQTVVGVAVIVGDALSPLRARLKKCLGDKLMDLFGDPPAVQP